MTIDVDVDALSCELVRAVRGKRSQTALSKELGFGSNVVYMWESGRRAPEVSRFIKMVGSGRKAPRLLDFFDEASPTLRRARLNTPRGVQRLIQELVTGHAKSHLAERISVDRTTLSRWVQGKTEPRLPDLLRLIRVTTQRLLPFVECFADPAKLKSTQALHADLEAQKRLAYQVPWSHAVLRSLELRGYRALNEHDSSFLAAQLGLNTQEVDDYLDELSAAGQVQWDGTHWVLGRVLTVDTRPDPEGNLRLKRHWAQTAHSRLASGKAHPDSLFSYNLFAVSEQNWHRIRELHLQYYDAVRALIDESEEADRVMLMNLQLVPLAERGEQA